MEWIKISEKLPERNTNVLIVIEKKKVPIKPTEKQIYIGRRISDRNIWIVENKFGFDIGVVSYWMPLPELPSKSEIDNAENK